MSLERRYCIRPHSVQSRLFEAPGYGMGCCDHSRRICLLEMAAVQVTLAFVYHRGEESLPYIERTKLRAYAQGLDSFPIGGRHTMS